MLEASIGAIFNQGIIPLLEVAKAIGNNLPEVYRQSASQEHSSFDAISLLSRMQSPYPGRPAACPGTSSESLP